MATVTQIQANRSNAQKSTGPRTAAGKERASRNALKHGLLAQEAVIQGEDPEEFEIYREGMLEELAVAGMVEMLLAERVVSLSWRLRRAERLQNAAFAALEDGEPTDLLEARHEEWKQLKGSEWERGVAGLFNENAGLGQVVVEDFGGARVLDRLLTYERRIESSLYRTMAQLRREREARAAAEREGVARSEGGLPAGEGPTVPAELGSFGAEAIPEVQRPETTFGSPEPLIGIHRGTGIPRSGRGQALPVVGNHGQDAHATGAAAGNHGRDARATKTPHDRSCETNPILGGVSCWAYPEASEEVVRDR